MGFLSGLKKVKRYIKLPDGYKLLSFWTSSQSVEMDDGSTLESNKPNWDDKYTRSEVDNKLSAIETNIDWKESVDTFTDISTAYPDPQDGWTVNVRDTDYTYRYNGEEWVVISANAIPKATQAIDGLLTKEDKTSYDSAVEKKHEHDNKSALDMITSEKIAGWNELSQNSVTGVKGNKEETYRTGNVNITAADIGAVDKSGDTMTGTLTAPTFSGNLEGTASSASYATNAGNSDTVDGKHFHWSGQSGQPSWLWGGNDGTNMYVYNPSNFRVSYAESAASASSAGNAVRADNAGYATSAGSASSLSTTVPMTNNFVTNLMSTGVKSGLSYSSSSDYYNLYSVFSDNLNSQFIQAAGTGYSVQQSGYYHLYIRGYMSVCSRDASVKRIGIRRGSTGGEWLLFDMKRASSFEIMNDSGDVYLTSGTILVPVFQIDSYGSTVITATVDVVMRILPLFVKE